MIKLQQIQDAQSVQTTLLQSLLNDIDKRGETPEDDFQFPINYFPIKDVGEMKTLENLVLENKSARKKLVIKIAHIVAIQYLRM